MIDPAGLAPRLRAWAQDQRTEIVAELAALVALDAPSGDRDALELSARLLADRLTELGGTVRRLEAQFATHLEARFGPAGRRPVVVLCHYDTVWPRGTAAARPLSRAHGTIRGPGVFDMRGGLAATLSAVRALRELTALERPLVLLLTGDEETGSLTSEEHIVRLAREAQVVLVPEPAHSDGGLKTARKGLLTYRLDVGGRYAHAGLDPERGVSAVHELIDLAAAARGLADAERGTTVNVGRIAGGERSNVVAAEASADIDVRVATMAEYERVERMLAELRPADRDARLELVRLNARVPLERTPAVARAYEQARELGRLLGLELGEGPAGGASDGNFAAALGVPVVDGLGPSGGGAHALDEHISEQSLVERAALIALLIAALAPGDGGAGLGA